MKQSRFIIVTLLVILALTVLIVVEALWAVRTYDDMRATYNKQIDSILDEASYQYATTDGGNMTNINIGNIERFHTIIAEELRTSGIETEFMVEVLATTDQEPIVLMSYGGEALGDRRISFENSYAPLILRLTVDDPHTDIVASMRSILILQGISILLLLVAFVYLLMTLFRAKSIDKIRRDLTHNITHELKTPIAAAYAATDVLLTMPDIAESKEQRDDYLHMTRDELERLNNLVEEILRTATEESRHSKLRLEECSIADIVNQVIASYAMKYSTRKITWHATIDPQTMVIADRFHLMGIISAIVDNAIKYSPDEAIINIEASMDSRHTYISISDKGMGIPFMERHRIFDKFYRITDGNRHDTKGYGIGLYYVRTMVKRHGGTTSIGSSINRGTTLRIKLPRYGTKRDFSC